MENTNNFNWPNNNLSNKAQNGSSDYFSARLVRNPSQSFSKVNMHTLFVEKKVSSCGELYFYNENGKLVDEINVIPGQNISLYVKLNQNYENFVVQKVEFFGPNSNNYVLASNETENNFIVKLPSIEESTNIDRSNWLYNNNVVLKITPTLVESSNTLVGDLGFDDTHNRYVFSMDRDIDWSEVELQFKSMLSGTKINSDNPIDVYFYLNGHTLNIDKSVVIPNIASCGWSLHFYNNENDVIDDNNGFGKITVSYGVKAKMEYYGAIYFGRSIEYKYMPINKGVQFLNINNDSWHFSFENIPSRQF